MWNLDEVSKHATKLIHVVLEMANQIAHDEGHSISRHIFAYP
jgi:hypothetical protein